MIPRESLFRHSGFRARAGKAGGRRFNLLLRMHLAMTDVFRQLVARLRPALAGELPGPEAQVRLAPRPRHGWNPGLIPEGCRSGAGLFLLYPVEGTAHVLLTEREDGLPHHAGQVSLPGGAVEAGETFAQAALREAEEETGLDPGLVTILGRLSPLHIPVSGFVLHPVVGAAPRRPELRRQAGEVARLLETPLSVLADPSRWSIDVRTFQGEPHQVPWLDLDGARLWGATAMVMAEFLSLLGIDARPA